MESLEKRSEDLGTSYLEKVKRTLTAILGFATVVASSIITTSVAVAIEPLPQELFNSVDARLTTLSQAKPTPFDEMAKRRRVASIDFGMLDRVRGAVVGGSAAVRLNLFDDVSVDSFIEWTAPTFSGGYSLSGHIVGDPPGSVTLVINGETVVGTVRTISGTYRLRSLAKDVLAILEVDESMIPFDCQTEVSSQAD